jgi:hypothetical protein
MQLVSPGFVRIYKNSNWWGASSKMFIESLKNKLPGKNMKMFVL